MLLIPCPHCGDRDETEFRNGGEVSANGDLFLRDNLAGIITESWFHIHGCQRWITLSRDTRTDDFT